MPPIRRHWFAGTGRVPAPGTWMPSRSCQLSPGAPGPEERIRLITGEASASAEAARPGLAEIGARGIRVIADSNAVSARRHVPDHTTWHVLLLAIEML